MAHPATEYESYDIATSLNGSARARLGCALPSGMMQSLVSRLQVLGVGGEGLRTLGVTSCSRGEGVTTITANLAVHVAQSGLARVLAIDANIVHPKLHELLYLDRAPGLIDLLTDPSLLRHGEVLHGHGDSLRGESPSAYKKSPSQVVQTAATNLSVVAAGSAPAGEGLSFPLSRVADVLASLAADYDVVLVDLPAADVVSPLVSPVSKLDGVLLVVEAQRVSDEAAARGKKQLLAMGARLLGAVFNKSPQSPGGLARGGLGR